jgi:hypothetical protein
MAAQFNTRMSLKLDKLKAMNMIKFISLAQIDGTIFGICEKLEMNYVGYLFRPDGYIYTQCDIDYVDEGFEMDEHTALKTIIDVYECL